MTAAVTSDRDDQNQCGDAQFRVHPNASRPPVRQPCARTCTGYTQGKADACAVSEHPETSRNVSREKNRKRFGETKNGRENFLLSQPHASTDSGEQPTSSSSQSSINRLSCRIDAVSSQTNSPTPTAAPIPAYFGMLARSRRTVSSSKSDRT